MDYSYKVCIRLFSDLFPCPWLEHIPHLKHARNRMQGDLEIVELPLPECLLETVELCRGCTHYEPIGKYVRKDECIENCASMHRELCRDGISAASILTLENFIKGTYKN